ncbi:PTS mannitol transporter subunit IICBA [Olsenella massiliensis]|uniref:PTS mannitol transporter subunit IICBA n=1 Tax=Olsenella massiliensis TaxID=1622075 RepID=UPI00071D8975|nr:PTS mannitol transporter subunit IICBA [Olsenella massiliensis]
MATAREKVARFGKFLSGMVMPNIGAFIAWGFLTALFIETGWIPNEQLATVVGPMLKYFIPVLIAGQGGYAVAGNRGRVIGGIAVFGAIMGSDYTMLMGAMLMGPLAGLVIKKWDEWADGWKPEGLEMLVDNFSLGLIGLGLAIIGFFGIGPFMGAILVVLQAGVQALVNLGLMPLLAIFIEPAKVLFLNNAIGNGIFVPIGTEQVKSVGESIMFMLESNPGPGVGMLLAYAVLCRDKDTKQSAPGAIIIQFLGGIHEIYFPYVLMNPRVIIGPIAGNIVAILFSVIFGLGLVGPASPGSIIAFVSMSPKSQVLLILVDVILAAAVSFFVSAPFVRSYVAVGSDDDVDGQGAIDAGSAVDPTAGAASAVSKIVFACDAGMGSSAMGATRFFRRVKEIRPDIKVEHASVDEIPSDADVIVCQKMLAERARKAAPQTAQFVVIGNFMNDPALDALQTQLTTNVQMQHAAVAATNAASAAIEGAGGEAAWNIGAADVSLGNVAADRESAIRACGAMLVKRGYVDEAYVDAMVERDREVSVYIGNGVAIPHGTNEAKRHVKSTGVVAMQFPEGIDFNGEKAYVLFGIAGKGDEHLQVLAKIADALSDETRADKLRTVTDVTSFLKVLG